MFYRRFSPALMGAILALLVSITASPAFAAGSPTPHVHTQRYHILSIDPTTNRLIDRLVSKQQFLQWRQSLRLNETAPGAHSPSAETTTVTPFINRTSDLDCISPNPFWKFWDGVTGWALGVCFANAGDISLNIAGVIEVDTGNNQGNFVANGIHFPGDGHQYCQNDILGFGNNPLDVTHLTIVNPTNIPCD